ncbi:MAG: DUF6879 family protein [Pseudonocardiaceae bacterium]
MNLIMGDDFGQLFRTFEHTAFRLEVRDSYNASPRENEAVRRLAAGESVDMSWAEGWLGMIREATAGGRRFMRVRVVSLPLTDYSRFGLWGAQLTNAAGEDIRYLTREAAETAGLPSHDYWLFDSRKLARMHFDDDDVFLGAEIIEDPREVVQHNYWRDMARHYAVRRDDFDTKQGERIYQR